MLLSWKDIHVDLQLLRSHVESAFGRVGETLIDVGRGSIHDPVGADHGETKQFGGSAGFDPSRDHGCPDIIGCVLDVGIQVLLCLRVDGEDQLFLFGIDVILLEDLHSLDQLVRSQAGIDGILASIAKLDIDLLRIGQINGGDIRLLTSVYGGISGFAHFGIDEASVGSLHRLDRFRVRKRELAEELLVPLVEDRLIVERNLGQFASVEFSFRRSGLLKSPIAALERARLKRVVDVLLAFKAFNLDAAGEFGEKLLDLMFEVVREFAAEFFGDAVSN